MSAKKEKAAPGVVGQDWGDKPRFTRWNDGWMLEARLGQQLEIVFDGEVIFAGATCAFIRSVPKGADE